LKIDILASILESKSNSSPVVFGFDTIYMSAPFLCIVI